MSSSEDDDAGSLNPFDPKRLRISQRAREAPAVRKILTAVQVRKPHKQEFFRVHPAPEMRIDTLVLDLHDDRRTYLISPEISEAIPGDVVAKTLYTVMTRQGAILLWPVRLPDEEGRLDEWNKSAHLAALQAEQSWVRLTSNMSAGTYDVFEALNQPSNPEWPELAFERLLELAFKDRFIDSLDHPAILRLMGEL